MMANPYANALSNSSHAALVAEAQRLAGALRRLEIRLDAAARLARKNSQHSAALEMEEAAEICRLERQH